MTFTVARFPGWCGRCGHHITRHHLCAEEPDCDYGPLCIDCLWDEDADLCHHTFEQEAA